MKKLRLLLGLVAILVAPLTFAQMNQGGTPVSYGLSIDESQIPTTQLAGIDLKNIQQEDALDVKDGHWPRIAVSVPAHIELDQNGLWTNVPGGRIWRHKVNSLGAKGMIFAFDDYYLPDGARLYIYSEDKTELLGAYTSMNNKADTDYWSCGILKSGSAIIEYFEPYNVQGQGHFNIYEIGHVYRYSANDVGQDPIDRGFGDSDPCQVNINCSPEGDNWQDQKNGVGRILLKDGASWGWCTGSLINNTAEDCTPYFLTAHHCGETASAADQAQWIFYFDYEATGCNNPGSEPGSNSTTGCSFVSHSNDGGGNSGSDYKLVMLNGGTPLPDTWGLYYNGWNVGASAATSGVGIHHPAGDIMKISTYTSSLVSTQWGSASGSHWRVVWSSTTNGHGVTEGGSSGSPIFNSNGLVVGTLTGGSSFCTSPNNPDQYGKMWYHWDQNANPFGGHLEQFLDPTNSGVTTLQGIYSPCTPQAPTCAASASATTVVAGGSIDFFDNSSGSPTSWSWNFGGGGTPNTSSQQNPTGIVFSTPGTYTVTLTASNAQGNCSTTLTITVVPSTGCDTLRFPPSGTLTVLTTNGTGNCGTGGYVAGHNAYCDMAKAEYFDNYSPYTHVTGGSFYLWHATDAGNGATVDFTVWDNSGTGGAPGTALATVSVPLSSLDINAGQTENTLIEILFNSPVNVNGNPFYFGYTMNGFGTGDSLGFVSNSAGDSSPNTAWEQWDTGDWYSFDNSWGISISQFHAPYMTDAPPTAAPSASTTSICEGNTITFDGSSSVNASGYTWSFPGGTPSTSSNATETVTYNSAGTYTAYLVAEGACQGQAIDSITGITVTTGISVSTTTQDENCGGADGQITVTPTGASQYSIDGGTTFQGSNTFTGLAAGTYDIVVIDGSGCQGTDQVTINNVGGPTINSTTDTDPECNGGTDGSIVINATGATQYSIDGGSTFQGSNSFIGLPAGTYNIVVDNGTCQTTSTVTLTDPTAVSHTATVVDAGCNPDGEISVSGSGGAGSYEYSIDNGVSFQTNGTFTGLAAGNYDVVARDANGCLSAATVEVVNGLSPITISSTGTDETCSYGNGSISITAGGGDGTYQYSIDGGSTFQTGSSFSNLPAGTYNIEVIDGSGCSSTSTETLANTGGVTASLSPTSSTICDGQSITLNAGGGSNYEWFVGATSVGTSNTLTDNPSTTTTYMVIVDDGTCEDTAYSTITVNSIPTTTVSPTSITICEGDDATLTASGGTSYFWAHSGETTASVVVSPTNQTTYTVIAYNGSCQGNSASVTVSVDPPAVALASANNTTVYLGAGATVNFNSAGSVGTSYSWDFGDGNNSTQTNPTHSYTSAGTYTVILTSTLGNCTDQDTITITVLNDLSAENLELSQMVNVYPNPTSGQVFIQANLSQSTDLEIRVYNPIGEIIDIISASDVTNRTFNVDLSNKAKGFYFVHLITDDGVVTKRISLVR